MGAAAHFLKVVFQKFCLQNEKNELKQQ